MTMPGVRFQVRKREGRWEVVYLAMGGRSWEIIDSFPTFFAAMVMATGQPPYGDDWRLYRTLTVRWA